MVENEIKVISEESLPEALLLVSKCFDKFVALDYSPEGVEAFYKFIDYDLIREKIVSSELCMFGYVEDSKIVGVVAIRKPCHVVLLFVDENFQKKGIAKAMLDKAICSFEGSEITVNSSPFALRVYEKMGFLALGEEQEMNGIRFVPMAKHKKGLSV